MFVIYIYITADYVLIMSETSSDGDDNNDLWSDLIPEELLLIIFSIGAQQYGPVPYLCRTAQVCHRWYQVSYHPSLWSEVDLSIGWITRDLSGLEILCKTRLYRTVFLDLTAWFGMTDQHLQCILNYCKHLRSLKLAHCSKLTTEGMMCLIHNRLELNELDISFTSPAISSHRCLQRLVPYLGNTLKKLHLSNVCVDNHFDGILHQITVHCRHLTYLDLTQLSYSFVELSIIMLDIEAFQYGCPNLEVLLMEKSFFKAKPALEEVKVFSPGFPKLNTFSAPENVTDEFLQRILKSSFDLESLKMNFKHSQDAHCQRLSIVSLKRLVIHGARPQQIYVYWHSSLVYLELSWLKSPLRSDAIDTFMKRIFDTRGPQFTALSSLLLCGCPVTAYGIRPVFDCCPKLNQLNLNFCAKLPHGWSRDYRGAELMVFKHVVLR
ncbi:hypothetical protein LSH36_342g03019 [Paralvinella palmiformis]|uniref:F-box domain-containing protein n=1 Tax=Paralvinella palmiformis TaxID=53620 RepID=A0AAD9JGZ7_9ANNE|nr:hypothetical protein LSH36_342g03019 [Paralvinella palmiformis]